MSISLNYVFFWFSCLHYLLYDDENFLFDICACKFASNCIVANTTKNSVAKSCSTAGTNNQY